MFEKEEWEIEFEEMTEEEKERDIVLIELSHEYLEKREKHKTEIEKYEYARKKRENEDFFDIEVEERIESAIILEILEKQEFNFDEYYC